MGNSLHNKIYLGRGLSIFDSRSMQTLAILGAVTGASLVWLAIRAYK